MRFPSWVGMFSASAVNQSSDCPKSANRHWRSHDTASGDLSGYLLRAENGGFDRVPVGSPGGSAMWDSVNTVMGWDHLTPQGIRIGIASFIALTVLAPGRPTGFFLRSGRWLRKSARLGIACRRTCSASQARGGRCATAGGGCSSPVRYARKCCEVLFNTVLMADAAVLDAQAISLG
jgi:hypothetical protein